MNKTYSFSVLHCLFVFFLSLTLSSPLVAQDLENGKKVFSKTCSSCHGPEGAGDGPIAAGLPDNMKPRNLKTGEFKVVKDKESMAELIKKGGPAFGLNPLMAAQPSLSDSDITDVIEYVYSLRK